MPMTFATLTGAKSVVGSIMSWMNYGKLDAEGILEEAQTMLYGRLRVREMKATDEFTVRVGASSIDVPDGFLDPIQLKDITNDVKIKYRGEADLEDMRSWTAGVLQTGDPCAYAVYDELINFDCKTRTQWRARAMFYQQPRALSSSNPTNFLTKRYPQLLRMACLATGARFSDDDSRFQREEALLFKEIADLAVTDEMSRSTEISPETE